jgi:hypothetical protein
MDKMTINLLKNPANGGIPAIANMINPKEAPKILFLYPIPEKLTIYFG